MARILIAWELGEAFGHLSKCLNLAEGLRRRGHEVVLALKDVRMPAGRFCSQGVTIVQAPHTPQRPRGGRPPANYADVLFACGFAQADDLAARLLAWQGVFSLARPDVVVADHAPTSLLAARLAGIAHLAIGISFSIPPAVAPWPSIRPWEQIPEMVLAHAEQRLDQVTEAAQKALGYAARVRMREVFGEHDVLDTFAELDHFGDARFGACYAGPIVSLPQVRAVAWQGLGPAKVLAYLRPEVPGFETVLRALAAIDAEVLCVAPGLAPQQAKRLATQRLRISLRPVDLGPLLEQAGLAIGYGGSSFAAQALLAGVPLLLRPRHVEQALLAYRVEAMGAGRLLDAQGNVRAVTTCLHETLHDPDCRRAAQAFSERYRTFSTQQAVECAIAAIERALAGTRDVRNPGHVRALRENPSACPL